MTIMLIKTCLTMIIYCEYVVHLFLLLFYFIGNLLLLIFVCCFLLRMIEQAACQQGSNPAELFLWEWSTWGKRRPTCKILLDLLVKMEHFRAADYLAENVLKSMILKFAFKMQYFCITYSSNSLQLINQNVHYLALQQK